MEKDIKNNSKKLLIVLMAILGIAIGFTSAYYQPQSNGSVAANVDVLAKTTDVLTFSKGNNISLTMTQQNFGSESGNLTGSSTVMASLLANNNTNSASTTYNLYYKITGNSFKYTSSLTNTPELLLTVADPSGNPVTSITGLTYTTVNGVSGFDITEQKGLIQIASNYSITSNSSTTGTTQTWTITVTLVNLGSNQQANTNKRFSGQAIIQKEEITTATLMDGNSVYSVITALNNGNVYYTTSIKRATELPNGFVASADNTISTNDSDNPVYVWYAEETEGVYAYYGDINADGQVNWDDLTAMDACIAGNNCTEAQIKLGDYDLDGDVDNIDRGMLDDHLGNYETANYLPNIFYAYPVLLETLEGISPYVATYGKYGLGTIYYYSTADIIYLNEDCEYMFYDFYYLQDIDDLAYFDSSFVTNLQGMFYYCASITKLDALANWDVSSVTDMSAMFYDSYALTSINALTNWDVSSVTSMSSIFYNTNINSVSSLANWNVSSVTDMSYMFYYTGIGNITPLSNWDVSSVTNMSNMFNHCINITSFTALANWDVSSVTDMSNMFEHTSVSSLSPISNWDVSSVTNMSYMFKRSYELNTIAGLSKWNVSSVTNMRNMFNGCYDIDDVNEINNWSINNVTFTANTESGNGFYYMFNDCNNIHPTFSKRAGTWSGGSFVPS